VLWRAHAEHRILITVDKDMGELAFRFKLPASSGIVLFRISTSSSEYVARVAVTTLESRDDWAQHFTVVEENRIRMTPLPPV
jgi:predicted nuclease of predicted toxin-antitoxin system